MATFSNMEILKRINNRFFSKRSDPNKFLNGNFKILLQNRQNSYLLSSKETKLVFK